jgi:hypothetical protein
VRNVAPEKVKQKAEAERLAKIIEHNTANAEHAAEFQVPIYNIWKQQIKSEGSSRFGNSVLTLPAHRLDLFAALHSRHSPSNPPANTRPCLFFVLGPSGLDLQTRGPDFCLRRIMFWFLGLS